MTRLLTTLALAIAATAVAVASTPAAPAMPGPSTSSGRGCSFRAIVSNQLRSDRITVTKISTASTPGIGAPIYKKQWDGSVAISAGHQHTFSFTVDLDCRNAHDVKVFYTRNGNDHDKVCYIMSGGTCAIN